MLERASDAKPKSLDFITCVVEQASPGRCVQERGAGSPGLHRRPDRTLTWGVRIVSQGTLIEVDSSHLEVPLLSSCHVRVCACVRARVCMHACACVRAHVWCRLDAG